MASLNTLYFKKETLEEILKVLNKKNEKGIEFTISISDEANQYNQNVSAFVSQTKEQREAKEKRYYVGNGRTFWTDGNIVVPEKVDANMGSVDIDAEEEDDGLPF